MYYIIIDLMRQNNETYFETLDFGIVQKRQIVSQKVHFTRHINF